MHIDEKIKIFAELGNRLNSFCQHGFPENFNKAIDLSCQHNRWFTTENILMAINSIALSLTEDKIKKWLKPYGENQIAEPKNKIAVIMAGNIPVVGFHDFLCVLASANIFIGKLSSQDKFLLPAIAEELIAIHPLWKNDIIFTEEILKNFDRVIATGSDNSSRYFEYYFGKYPHIIRKNRNSIAILTGDESLKDLKLLADDIFLYFGLGCRNVTKICIPENYNFTKLENAFLNYKDRLYNHNKFMNNYEYQKSIFLINSIPHIDFGYCLLKEDSSNHSPIGVIHYQYYKSKNEVLQLIENSSDQIQCIISKNDFIDHGISFGQSQKPELWDYADGVNTLKFLLH
jgi:hypothetical protein